jgi:hypothetical protein
MATRVKITIGPVTVDAEFFDTECSKMISDPVPASEVNVVGRISGEAGILRGAKGKGLIRIYKDT